VHRLDKDTSGVLLIAKDERSFKVLQKQFKRHEVGKQYKALVIGEVKDEEFEINAPLKRNPKNRFKFAVVSGGKDALTKGVKLGVGEIEGNKYTLLDIFPKTGRTHQIRVHLAAMGFPIIGDNLYSNKLQLKKWSEFFPRMMLHAQKITFLHPITREEMSFEADLPSEFPVQF
jgi:23S rRNA pseudouridine1911/1915/1917 synthase